MKLTWKALFGLSMLMILMIGEVNAQQQPLPHRALVVGTKESPPFSMKGADGNWTGLSIDLWQQIAAELKLTYEFRELDLKQLLAGVKDRSLDAAVAALTINSEREKSFDFTHAYYSTGLGIAVASKVRNPWFSVVRRFFSFTFLKIVLSLALLLLAVGVLVWWFERKKNPQQFNGGVARGIGSGFWWSAVTMTTVGYGDKAPVTFAGRFIGLIWMFVGIILISSFTAAITSSLTVSQLGSVVKGPEDLPRVTVGTIINTTSESHLEQIRISYLPYKTPQEGLIALKKGDIDALVYDEPMLRYYIHRDYPGSLHVLPKLMLRQDYGIALTSNSPVREQINVVLLQKIREKAWQDEIIRYLGE